MLYAMSEIAFFILLASLLGAAAGWWLARSGKVSVMKAMDRSGAHAAADRELDTARAEVAQLAAKLAIATEAIRELETERVRSGPAIPEVPAPPVELHSVSTAAGTERADFGEVDAAPGTPTDGPVADAPDDAAPPTFPTLSGRARGGKRLSDRVAEASPVLARPEREAPKIDFSNLDD